MMKNIIFLFVLFFLANTFFSCATSGISFKNNIKKHRETYLQSFLTNPRSPLQKEDLDYLDFFDAKKSWVKKTTFEANTQPETLHIPTYSGITKPYYVYGFLTFNHDGKIVKLEIYKSAQKPENPLYKNHLFLPFKDETNDETTYGGGRYIDLSVTDILNNQVKIDFNKSYNPWCAYSDGYNCPVPPKANHLPFQVSAGEKAYKGTVKTK